MKVRFGLQKKRSDVVDSSAKELSLYSDFLISFSYFQLMEEVDIVSYISSFH